MKTLIGRIATYTLPLLLGMLPILGFSQDRASLKKIDSLIAIEDFNAAQKLIENLRTSSQVAHGNNPGRLVYPLGKIDFLKDSGTNFESSTRLLQELLSTATDSVQYEALLGMGLLLVDQGKPQKADSYVTRANVLAKKGLGSQRIMASEYYLAEIGLKSGNFNQLLERTENALRMVNTNPREKFQLTPRVYNFKASLMHFTAQPDSAEYYFEKALKLIPELDKNPENHYYLPGLISGNWFMVKASLGQFEEAMELTTNSIGHYTEFLKNTHNHPLTEKVHFNLSLSYRNLGSLFNDMGDVEKAKQVSRVGYHHAKKHFLKHTVQYFSAILMMGEAHLYANDLEEAKKYFEEAEKALSFVEGENTSFYANLYGALANLENKRNNHKSAIDYFQKTIFNYTKSNPTIFDQNQIYALMNMAHVYAKDGQFKKAQEIIESTHMKTISAYGSKSYLANAVLLSKIRILYKAGAFKQTIALCQEWLNTISLNHTMAKTEMSYFQGDKIEVLLFLAKSKYELLEKGNITGLLQIKPLVEEAINALELRKSLVTSREAVTHLIETNGEVFDFAKKIHLDLFQTTHDEKYLHKVITLHESSIYNRIRARLNLKENSLQVIPVSLLKKEKEIKERLNSLFTQEENEFIVVDSLAQSLNEWNSFLDTLKLQYPEYHKLRYASTSIAMEDLKKNLGPDVTLVRYFFVEDALYAAIITSTFEKLVSLNFDRSVNTMDFMDYQSSFETVSNASHKLYQALWAPLAKEVTTTKVVIFPDRELFNISFELLAPEKLNSFKEFQGNSLLAKYQISYNYSLLLLHGSDKVLDFEDDIVAFAPEFHSQMKQEYALAISDSVSLDRSYLTLLPQPFNFDLVKKFTKRFEGTAFLNEQATKQLFTERAKEHKIIHIGTHAESNNSNPELSRLVFAKSINDSININDNYLYTFEIYNQNLNSNLAILTGCETGKPSYQPGEGMISLAHAFNYAGSESILTSLWEIDEQSSTKILEYFYGHLEDGLSKDEALRNAKLDYLNTSEGRTIHPQYWAGLILMGETLPVQLSTSYFSFWWVLLLIVILVILFLVFNKKKVENGY